MCLGGNVPLCGPCTLSSGLNMLQSGLHKQHMKDLFVELCLTVPVRLSSLLPYLPMLMDPLVSALNGSQTLVSQGLRTLELCVDNLQPDFLYDHIQPVRAELMQVSLVLVSASRGHQLLPDLVFTEDFRLLLSSSCSVVNSCWMNGVVFYLFYASSGLWKDVKKYTVSTEFIFVLQYCPPLFGGLSQVPCFHEVDDLQRQVLWLLLLPGRSFPYPQEILSYTERVADS